MVAPIIWPTVVAIRSLRSDSATQNTSMDCHSNKRSPRAVGNSVHGLIQGEGLGRQAVDGAGVAPEQAGADVRDVEVANPEGERDAVIHVPVPGATFTTKLPSPGRHRR